MSLPGEAAAQDSFDLEYVDVFYAVQGACIIRPALLALTVMSWASIACEQLLTGVRHHKWRAK